MPDNKPLNLSKDDREAALKETTKLLQSLSFMHELLSGGNFNSDEANCHMSLLKFGHDALARLFGMDPLSKDAEQAYAMLRDANGRIHDLEQQLAAGTTAAAARSKLAQLESWFCTWYQLAGMHYMSIEYGRHGLSFDTSDEIEHPPIAPEDVSFGDKEFAVKIAPVVPYAFEDFDKKADTFHDNLRDTQKNHDALIALFKSAFPDVRIHGFNSHTDGPDEFMLRMKGFVPYEDIEKWHDRAVAEAEKIAGRNTGALYVRAAELAGHLASRTYMQHERPDRIKSCREELAYIRAVTGLWDQVTEQRMEDGPCAEKTSVVLTLEWELDGEAQSATFLKNTAYDDIARWFEDTFKLDAARDLTGTSPKDKEACDGRDE